MITGATYRKLHFFTDRKRLEVLQDLLFGYALKYDWKLEAWAIFSNHYHFVAFSGEPAENLSAMLRDLHSASAHIVNQWDGVTGRKVWYEYWDTHLTFERSYLARLNYVHQNAVHHGIVSLASTYPFCSAKWFEQGARPAFVESVHRFKVDRLNIRDDYEVLYEP